MIWRIGGVRYRVHGVGGMDGLFEEPGAVGRLFLSAEPPDEHTVDVDIRVFHEKAPDVGETVLFDSGAAWTLRRTDAGLAMIFQPNGQKVPFWTALFQADGLKVDVFMDPFACPQPFPPLSHPLDQMILVFALASRNGALFHCTGVNVKGRGLLFAGKSGAGKSTMARLFSDRPGVCVLSDERVVIREKGENFWMYGTPWHSDSQAAEAASAPLSALFFLHHSRDNRMEICPKSTALHHLLPLVSIPWYDRERLPALMDLCGRMVATTPCYHLHFRPDHGVIENIMDLADTLEKGAF